MLTVLVFFIKYFSSYPGQKSILSSYLGKNSMLSSYICRPKEYVILLSRPKEYFILLSRPKEYFILLSRPKKYFIFLSRPKEYIILLSRPKEYAQWSNGAWSSNTDHLYRKKRGNYQQNQNHCRVVQKLLLELSYWVMLIRLGADVDVDLGLPLVDRPTQLFNIWIFKSKRHSRAIC